MPGGRLSYGQLEQLWISAGGSRALAPLMAAIALAESGGDPAANNYTDNGGTQTSWGLWQVSDGTHNEYVPNLNDPYVNAKAAVAKYKQQGLSAWGTYDSGAYRQYYQGGVPPSSLPQGGGGALPAQTTGFNPNPLGELGPLLPLAGPVGLIASIGEQIKNLFSGGGPSGLAGIGQGIGVLAADLQAALKGIEWLFYPSHWVRIICFLTGAALFIPGLRNLSRAGSGDMSLALGIIEVTLAAGLFFIAFHNIPEDVKSVDDLAGWVSREIRGQGAHFTGSTV